MCAGQILEEIGNLLGLELLNIKAIKGLTGQIPTSIFNISSLKAIDLSNNSLSGQIPEEIGNLLGLELLNIKAIKGLIGQIPTLIFNISSLKTIDLTCCT
ncbi:hypothetical protein GOBAR_DD30454 [Gossypium barbadense]|nr:hypothetical protein GOBAR_DD30454 [Gossypium barbadense]